MVSVEQITALVMQEIMKYMELDETDTIPVGVSNRHVHLSKEHLISLFGEDAKLTKIKDLSQPGQFACKETVTIVGTKGCIENVRILGPTRSQTQVELLASDCFKLGIKAPLKLSGKLDGTPGIVVTGPNGCEKLHSGVLVAKRHIHMTNQDASKFNCRDNEVVKVLFEGERGGILDNVVIRVTDSSKLDFHIDTEEANCMGASNNDRIKIVK